MLILTLYTLFSEDLRLLAFGTSSDNVFIALSILSIILFAVELGLSCYAKDGYFNSFFFSRARSP